MTTPPFADLPPSSEPHLRWCGSSLMDEEQYRMEGWHVAGSGQWRASLRGMQEYAELRSRRRAERKAAWRAREEADDEWSGYVTGLVEGAG